MSEPIGERDDLNIYDRTPDEFAVRRRLEDKGITTELLYCLRKTSSLSGRQYWCREMCYRRDDGEYQGVRGDSAGRVVIERFNHFADADDRNVILGPVSVLNGRSWDVPAGEGE